MPQSIGLRNAEDWRGSRLTRRYSLQHVITPTNTAAGANILGLRKLDANPEVFISRIRIHEFTGATAGVAANVGWKRASGVTNGALMTAADIPEMESDAPAATLEVRTTTGSGGNLVGGTKANQYILTHQASPTAAPPATTGHGFIGDWTARDLSERIQLTADEGLILEWITTGDVDNRFHLLLVWEEIS